MIAENVLTTGFQFFLTISLGSPQANDANKEITFPTNSPTVIAEGQARLKPQH
jgi:hypothetical protein